MIHAEMIQITTLDSSFHRFCEEIYGHNPASVVQSGKKPRSELAYQLAYFKAFFDPKSDTSKVQHLLSMMHIGMMVAGPELDIAEIVGTPHGLNCLTGYPTRQGINATVMTGNCRVWADALLNIEYGSPVVHEWGLAIYKQFAQHDLIDLMNVRQPDSTQNGRYFLD